MVTRLDVRSLCVGVPTPSGGARPVDDVSLALAKGESLDIVGESGSGKTLLALALLGLEPPGARRIGEAWLERRDDADDGRGVNLLAASSWGMRALRGHDIAIHLGV